MQHGCKALKLLVITLRSHVFLLIKHPVGECDIIGFLDLEILKWLVQQIEEETFQQGYGLNTVIWWQSHVIIAW